MYSNFSRGHCCISVSLFYSFSRVSCFQCILKRAYATNMRERASLKRTLLGSTSHHYGVNNVFNHPGLGSGGMCVGCGLCFPHMQYIWAWHRVKPNKHMNDSLVPDTHSVFLSLSYYVIFHSPHIMSSRIYASAFTVNIFSVNMFHVW